MQFRIHQVSWQTHAAQLQTLRKAVFVEEQKVPVALEWDGLDDTALHLLAFTHEGEAIGCSRLLGDGSIGRMAVIKSWRNHGVGMALLQRSIAHYQKKEILKIHLSAQTHAIKFYEKAGFKVCSAPYLDAGIWHVSMQLGT